jgi:hypothetical protein
MIKTYEIKDPNSKDDHEMVEFDPEVVENLNWWQSCFVPKYSENSCRSGQDEFSESQLPKETHQKGSKEEQLEESRGRFNSEDVTVSTNLTTPPGTPNVHKAISKSSSNISNNISPDPSNSNDLESASIRNGIPAIDEEEVEEVDISSEDDVEKVAGR